ncbi:hypothetical protein [Lusitaniella coriacea]
MILTHSKINERIDADINSRKAQLDNLLAQKDARSIANGKSSV